MKTLQDLKLFSDATLLPKLRVLEKERKGIVRKLAINFVVIWGLLGIYFCYCFGQRIQEPLYLVLPPIICFYIWQKRQAFLRNSYVSVFKSNVIEPIVGFVDEELKYVASRYIDETDFIRSYIFNIAHDVYTGDDYVCGIIGETEIEFSELYSAYRISTRGGSYWHTIFKGIFFIADFNKNFSGKTIILPDSDAHDFLFHAFFCHNHLSMGYHVIQPCLSPKHSPNELHHPQGMHIMF